jgi:Ni,Fe-hydrogenase III large subunit/Ni,Fe-hydrogenase III component G
MTPASNPFIEFVPDAMRLTGAAPVWRASIATDALYNLCAEAKKQKAHLVALWGSDETPRAAGFAVHVALSLKPGLLVLSTPLPQEHPHYPALDDLFPSANRMQRAVYDLFGIHAQGAADHRKWLRHGAWPGGEFPLRKKFDAATESRPGSDRYPFMKVEGEGVHEIPVGPVHAGVIEPGHFRFSVVGEKVLRLEERLGYKHKGIEKRFEQMTLAEGARLAGRVSGDSTVAYAWAYAMAVEGAATMTPPRHALNLRALALELERIANHLGDIGYLANDVAFSFGFFQFWRLKENLLRMNGELFGHRYLMDYIVPGGVACDLTSSGAERLRILMDQLEAEVTTLRAILDEHAGAQDRFIMTGQVTPQLAERMGLTGLAGRASGIARDLRVDHPVAPYDELKVRMASHTRGDVAARLEVRFAELIESMRLVRELLEKLTPGDILVPLSDAPEGSFAIGWIEGWRGEIMIALEIGAAHRIHRCHPHDPSWQNWPLLERAAHGNIVPDFPLINKSFNLSYSGQDL